jgi:hypothetical protein
MDTQLPEWTRWPVARSAIWVGTLTALAVGTIIGLLRLALGAHKVSSYVDWKKARLVTLVFSIGGPSSPLWWAVGRRRESPGFAGPSPRFSMDRSFGCWHCRC